jgi:hypothetical protein
VDAVHPDDFLLDQLDMFPVHVETALFNQVRAASRPALSYAGLLLRLQRAGVESFVDEVRRRRFEDSGGF